MTCNQIIIVINHFAENRLLNTSFLMAIYRIHRYSPKRQTINQSSYYSCIFNCLIINSIWVSDGYGKGILIRIIINDIHLIDRIKITICIMNNNSCATIREHRVKYSFLLCYIYGQIHYRLSSHIYVKSLHHSNFLKIPLQNSYPKPHRICYPILNRPVQFVIQQLLSRLHLK